MLTEVETAVPVVVHAPDPISLVGTRGQLLDEPMVELVDAGGGPPGAVAVVLAESLDEPTMRRLRQLRAEGTRVVLVVCLLREAELLRVVECGVGAIVWRHEATGRRLCRAVLAASRGEGEMPPDLLGRLVAQVGALRRSGTEHAAAPATGLSPREVDVLRLVAEGMDTAEIAGKLSYSERTIENLIYGLTNRLQLRNRAHAVAYALREGYF
nr:response regulator transcription factor [Streptacidiphilus fuscans]